MRPIRESLLVLSMALTAGCGSSGSGGGSKTSLTFTTTVSDQVASNLDLLLVIDDSSSTTAMQQKLVAQLPTFMQVLEQLPGGLPNVHIGVISTDMGAPGDATASIGCTAQGDHGAFFSMPRGACTATTLSSGDTFISDGNGQTNFTDPIDQVLQCITLLGSSGCGFGQPLASLARALGADGAGTPSQNAGFLRPDAYLGIVLLTNDDDCSAPSDTTIFSLNGGAQSIANPDGPISRYRCAGGPRGGHLCQDPATGAMIVPPLNPPAAATGNPPILNLENCQDNETGNSALTPVKTFVDDIKSLKADPDNQIVVAGIVPPASPYAVEWLPPSSPTAGTAGQLWPSLMQSCGAAGSADLDPMATQTTTDGTAGNPAVRISQFVQAFTAHALTSVCDASYAPAMTALANEVGAMIKPPCLATGPIVPDAQGQPTCSVINHVTDSSGTLTDVAVANCNENGGAAPCWTLGADPSCPSGSVVFNLVKDPATMSAAGSSSTLECSLCGSGVTPGC